MKKIYWIILIIGLIIIIPTIYLTLRPRAILKNNPSVIVSKDNSAAGITFLQMQDPPPIPDPVSKACLQDCDQNYPPKTGVTKAEITEMNIGSIYSDVSMVGDAACDNYTLDKTYKIDPSGPWPLVYTEGKCPNGESVERMSLAYGGNGLSNDGSLSGLACVKDNVFWIQDSPGGWSDKRGGRTVEFYGPFKGGCGYSVYSKKNAACKTACTNDANK